MNTHGGIRKWGLFAIGCGFGLGLVYLVLHDRNKIGTESKDDAILIQERASSRPIGLPETAVTARNAMDANISSDHIQAPSKAIDLFNGDLDSVDMEKRVSLMRLYVPSIEDQISGHWKLTQERMGKIREDLEVLLSEWKELESDYRREPVLLSLPQVNQLLFNVPILPIPIENSEVIRNAVLTHLRNAYPEAREIDNEKAAAYAMMQLGITPLPRVLSGIIQKEGVSGRILSLQSQHAYQLRSDGGSTESAVQTTMLPMGDPRLEGPDGRYFHLLPEEATNGR